MKTNVYAELLEKYSYMFALRETKPGEPLQPIVFGVECGPGWYKILRNLMWSIDKIDTNRNFRFTQIKEKFGTLRAYYLLTGSTEELDWAIQTLIDTAEKESESICEECGGPGQPNGDGGWIRTLCSPCREKRGR